MNTIKNNHNLPKEKTLIKYSEKMPKRSLVSDDSEDDHDSSSETRADSPQSKKRKNVEFEPVRICSIGSVVCL
jgi:hypothetical protein